MLANQGGDSGRVTEARLRAERRLRRQRDALRPLGWAVVVFVTVGTFASHPAPGFGNRSTVITVALVLFIATVATAISDWFVDCSVPMQLGVLAAMGGAGVALTALQPRGATALGAGAAVWMAVARLPLSIGVGLGAAITVAQDTAVALTGSTLAAALAATLLCVLLGLVAYFLRRSRIGQDHTEMLLAELADARDEQAHAAAIAERGRIASELHDVLAHSLSAAAIQLQGARLLAERERAEPQLRTAIHRAGQLVTAGLADARQAVGALRGEPLPTISELSSLVDSFRRDMDLPATLSVQGDPRILPADASLALYRGAQEALTNVVRYAPGAATSVVLHYRANHTSVSVANASTAVATSTVGLPRVGGGHGLIGMRERLERVGGSMQAGPSDHGWRVDLVVPR